MRSTRKDPRSAKNPKRGGASVSDGAPGRDAHRLLTAMAHEGAAPARSDLREGYLVVAAPRNGVTSIVANAPLACGQELERRCLARWSTGGPSPVLELTPEGAALARRLAAPEGLDPFAAQHADIAVKAIDPTGSPVVVNEAESPLTWLARRKGRDGAALLDSAQVDAGERFRRDVEIAQLRPRVTSDWTGVTGSGRRGPQDLHVGDLAIAARQRLDRAAEAVGPDLSGLLVDVCGFQKGLELVERERAWPPRSAKVVLRIALDRLAAHYGLASQARGPERAGRSRNWGAPGYRPEI